MNRHFINGNNTEKKKYADDKGRKQVITPQELYSPSML